MESETESYWSNWLAIYSLYPTHGGEGLSYYGWSALLGCKRSCTTNAMITVTGALLHKLCLPFLHNVLQVH